MTTLAQAKPRVFELGNHNHIPVIASDIIYEGSVVGDNGSGYARPLVAGDPFLGFARTSVDNSSGSAGDRYAEVERKGAIELPVTSLAITDFRRPVYASDDDTFSLAGAGTFIGHLKRFVSSGKGIVAFDADMPEGEIIVSLPIDLASITGSGDVLTTYTPGFAGRIKKLGFAVTDPVTTGSKAATLNAEIGTTNVTGGAVALTSANCTPLGAIIDGSAITALNAFSASDTISIESASVTAFSEGQGVLIMTLGR